MSKISFSGKESDDPVVRFGIAGFLPLFLAYVAIEVIRKESVVLPFKYIEGDLIFATTRIGLIRIAGEDVKNAGVALLSLAVALHVWAFWYLLYPRSKVVKSAATCSVVLTAWAVWRYVTLSFL
jgi:hypothetical protein